MVANTDENKIKLILRASEVDVVPVAWRKIGAKDLGIQDRARYILIIFNTVKERNEVKKASPKLKEIPELKNIYVKADLAKAERNELTRLYKTNERMVEEEVEES